MRYAWLALGSLVLVACAPRAQAGAQTGTPYVCTGGVTLGVTYGPNVARVDYGGVVYTLPRQNGGVGAGNTRFADPVTSWRVGRGGGVLSQNGQIVVAGC